MTLNREVNDEHAGRAQAPFSKLQARERHTFFFVLETKSHTVDCLPLTNNPTSMNNEEINTHRARLQLFKGNENDCSKSNNTGTALVSVRPNLEKGAEISCRPCCSLCTKAHLFV